MKLDEAAVATLSDPQTAAGDDSAGSSPSPQAATSVIDVTSTTSVESITAAEGSLERVPRPAASEPSKVMWPYLIVVGIYHLLALLALLPWFFSWTGVVASIVGVYIFATLGINLCYHRLLTHRSFACPVWLEHFFAILGVCSMQDTPARWVAVHRMHHHHPDEQPDPHTPLVNFFWSHMGWLLVENRELSNIATYERYARDVLRDPFYLRLERNLMSVWVNVAMAALIYLVGFVCGWIMSGDFLAGIQFGLSLVIWGVFVRTVLAWHITWSVNSITHMWGYRNYNSTDNSRNNLLVGFMSNGEGWHNNHHADQRSAAHGHHWWELDVTYLTIKLLERVGLAWDVLAPNKKTLATQTPHA